MTMIVIALYLPENCRDNQTEIAVQGLSINSAAFQMNQTRHQTHLAGTGKAFQRFTTFRREFMPQLSQAG
ncbi:MAG: hypothetical protein IKU14_07530, partial [Rhodocyclaceae bacterium]|nr:hypothetical protein [Rhodocyclaceae bacterium]